MPIFKRFKPNWLTNNLRWSLVGVLSLIALICPMTISEACGPGPFEFSGYSFLHADIIESDPHYTPYFLGFENLYQGLTNRDSAQIKGNLAEWSERFCEVYKTAEIAFVVYQSSIDELRVLRTAAKSEKTNLPSRLLKNTFARHLMNKKCIEVVDYLIFAKRCEPHVTAGNPWEPPVRDSEAMGNLIDEGLRAFKKTKSHYVKLRYAYQLIRLAHYRKDYAQTLELYDFLLPKTDNDPSILEDWILGHKAGALLALGKNVEASYLYALIFQRCPSKRETAFRSFQINTDEEWHQCQLLCQDDPERATLYALRAHAEDSKAAEEMAAIYELDPHNANLELLLLREVRKLEKDLLGIAFNDEKENNRRFYDLPRRKAGAYLEQLQILVNQCAWEQKVTRPLLWRIADAYLKVLDGELFAAKDSFDLLQPIVPKGPLKEQLTALQLALKVSLMDSMTPEMEEMVYEMIHRDPYYRTNTYLPDFVNDRMAFLYKRDGHPGWAFRCRYTLNDLKPNPQEDILNDLLAGDADSTHHNGLFDAFMMDASGKNIRNDLLDMKGTLLMSQGKLEAAREVLRLVPNSERNKYQLNPFTESLQDCVECPVEDTIFYNKVELIDHLLALEYKARSDMEFGAYYFYQLGLAHYNMTYFGNCWEAMDYYRSGANWDYEKNSTYFQWYSPYGNRENQDCSQAMEYFEKARTLAHDPELSAKAAFMAARCEQNNYFLSKDCQYSPYRDEIPNPPEIYRYYFDLLKNKYTQTAFYQEIIRECKFFAAYATR